IDYLFESPQMRTMFYKFSEEWGTPLRAHGMGMVSLISMFFLTSNNRVAVGGTHTLAHAMAMAATREGVDIHERCHVREILVENGVSTGIQLDDGRIFKANKMVISNADVKQTLVGMLGEKNLSDKWIKQAKNFKYGHGMCITLVHMGLHEAPNYKSAKWNEDANRSFITNIGAESPEDILKHSIEVEMGVEPSISGGKIPCVTSVPSLFAVGYAPKGKHNLYCGWFAPNASSYTPQEWREISDNLHEGVIESTYKHYAPNMTMSNVVGSHIITPYTLEKENLMPEGDFCLGSMRLDQLGHCRPFPEAARYKTEVENVYMCSSGNHPFGGLSTGVGYAAYKQVAEDFNLSYKPWENHPRGY
ncbi:MAG: FAD-binding protein, partial [Desulfuromonadales bacterium]|nr:FAD-binding protein [Desulfuromonadales bacterium]